MLGTHNLTRGTGLWSMLPSLRIILIMSVTTSLMISTEFCPDFAWTESLTHPSWAIYPKQIKWLLLPLQDSRRWTLLIFKQKPYRLKKRITSTRGNSGRALLESCISLSPRVARRLRSRHSGEILDTYTWQWSQRAKCKKISRCLASNTCRNSSRTHHYQMAHKSSFQNMLNTQLMSISTEKPSRESWLSFK